MWCLFQRENTILSPLPNLLSLLIHCVSAWDDSRSSVLAVLYLVPGKLARSYSTTPWGLCRVYLLLELWLSIKSNLVTWLSLVPVYLGELCLPCVQLYLGEQIAFHFGRKLLILLCWASILINNQQS